MKIISSIKDAWKKTKEEEIEHADVINLQMSGLVLLLLQGQINKVLADANASGVNLESAMFTISSTNDGIYVLESKNDTKNTEIVQLLEQAMEKGSD